MNERTPDRDGKPMRGQPGHDQPGWGQQGPDEPGQGKPRRRTKRWGLRTLGFLTIALVSLIASNVIGGGGNEAPAIATVGVLVGFVGAGYCTIRGLLSFTWLPR